MLRHDNPQWCLFLTLCLLYMNGVIASVIKPDISVALDDIAGYDLSEADMSKYHIWPQGIVYYYIDDFSFDKVLRDRIRSYLDQINTFTGLQFMEIPQPPKDDDSRWVFFVNRKAQSECSDVAFHNFTSEGVQKVVVGYDCVKSEDLAEIILSLVGVPPQHNAPNRDDYITVNFDNILPEKHYLFKKLQPEDWMFNNFEYDFASAGHYTTHKHTSNGAETISPKKPEAYKEGNKELSAMDIKKIRTTYNYISLKGKNKIKVPECSKLFVTGSNFSNYLPATKSDNRFTKPAPNPSDDISTENTKNNMSKEVTSNESRKPEKSKDKTENKADNKTQTNEETENENFTGEETKTDSEQKIKLNKKKPFLAEKKLTLLKKKGKNNGKKEMDKLLLKSDYSTGDEGYNKFLNGKDQSVLDTQNLYKGEQFLTEKKKSLLKNSKKEKQKLNKEKHFLAEKKKSLLTYSGKDERGKKDSMEKLLHKSDSSTSGENHNKFLNEREEQSAPLGAQNLNKGTKFLSEKKKLLVKNSGKDIQKLYKKKKLPSEKKMALLKHTGKDKQKLNKETKLPSEKKMALLKHTGKDKQKLNKETKLPSEKKMALLKHTGKDKQKLNKETKLPSEKKMALLKYTGKDKQKLNKETKLPSEKKMALLKHTGKDKQKLNKETKLPSEKKMALLKHTGKDKQKLNKETKLPSEKKMALLKHTGKDKQKLNKETKLPSEKKMALLKHTGKDKQKLNKETKLPSEKKMALLKHTGKDKQKLDKKKTFISEKKKSLLKNSGKDKLKLNKEKKKLEYSGKDKSGLKDNSETLLDKSDFSKGDEGYNKYLNERVDQSNSHEPQNLSKPKKLPSEKKMGLLVYTNKRKLNKDKKKSLKHSGKNKPHGKGGNKEKLLLQSDYSTGEENNLKKKRNMHFL